jgi:hypothetical protein
VEPEAGKMEENKRGDYVEEEGSKRKHMQEDTKNLCFMINRGDRRFEIPGAKFPGNLSNCMECALRDYKAERLRGLRAGYNGEMVTKW